MLDIKTVTYNEVNYDELDRFITQEFNLPYSFESVCIEEWSNDSSHSFQLTKDAVEKWTYEKKDFENALKKERNYTLLIFLEKLCHMGKIPEGNLLVEVCW